MARRWLVGATAVAALAAAACSASTSGQGTTSTDSPTTSTPAPRTSVVGPVSIPATRPVHSPTPRVTTPVPVTSVTAPITTPSSSTPNTPVITVTGADGTKYRAEVLAKDTITDCAAHSYGAPIIAYFREHPCHQASRRIVAINTGHNDSIAIMSLIAVDAAVGPSNDYYKWAGKLVQLEKADNTGSVNDLLREGARINGLPSQIPSHEAFGVFSQDTVVLIADAWNLSTNTQDQDPQLLKLEENLFPGELTSP